MPFAERLELQIALSANGTTATFGGGAVEAFSITLNPWGVEGSVTLRTSPEESQDGLLARVTSQALLEVVLSFRTRREPPVVKPAEWMRVRALVTGRRLQEMAAPAVVGAPVFARRYLLQFEDAAAALWRSHHPAEVRTDVSLRAVIEGNRPPQVQLTWDWPLLEAERRLVCLALGTEQEEQAHASFYDWLIWLVREEGGVFEFTAADGSHRLGAAPDRTNAATTSAALEPGDVGALRWVLHDAPRSTAHVLNGSAIAPADREVENARSVANVRRDRLLRTPLAAELDGPVARARAAQRATGPVLWVSCARVPGVDVTPGRHVRFDEAAFGPSLRASGDRFRVRTLRLEATRSGPDLEETLDEADGLFEVDAGLELVPAGDPTPSLPPFLAPRWPLRAEGRVVSVGGGEDDRTWLTFEDPATSITQQQVELPLWNVKVPVPFEPGPFSGHAFFPSYKRARVKVELGFAEARIARFLDWAEDARPPAETQGNRIVWGKRASDGTALAQRFEDGKPVLEWTRRSGGDEQRMELSEGMLRLTVFEQPTTPALSPTYDVTVQVEAARGRLVMQVKGDVAALSSKAEVAQAAAVASVESAVDEVGGAVDATQAKLDLRIDGVKDALETELQALGETGAGLAAAAASAKAELAAELAD